MTDLIRDAIEELVLEVLGPDTRLEFRPYAHGQSYFYDLGYSRGVTTIWCDTGEGYDTSLVWIHYYPEHVNMCPAFVGSDLLGLKPVSVHILDNNLVQNFTKWLTRVKEWNNARFD